MIFSAIEVETLTKEEIIALMGRAPSLRYLSEMGERIGAASKTPGTRFISAGIRFWDSSKSRSAAGKPPSSAGRNRLARSNLPARRAMGLTGKKPGLPILKLT